jgi:hypothetical protein
MCVRYDMACMLAATPLWKRRGGPDVQPSPSTGENRATSSEGDATAEETSATTATESTAGGQHAANTDTQAQQHSTDAHQPLQTHTTAPETPSATASDSVTDLKTARTGFRGGRKGMLVTVREYLGALPSVIPSDWSKTLLEMVGPAALSRRLLEVVKESDENGVRWLVGLGSLTEFADEVRTFSGVLRFFLYFFLCG